MINVNLSNKKAALAGAVFGILLTLFIVDEFTIYIFIGYCIAAYIIAKNWRNYGE
jgi:Na+(H+)/acetate symporter ActP